MLRRLERSIEATCRQHAVARGYMLMKVTSVIGIPDRLLVMSGAVSVFVEFKRPGERPSAIQRYRAGQLSQLGHRAFVVDSVGAFDNLMDDLESEYRLSRSWEYTRQRQGRYTAPPDGGE